MNNKLALCVPYRNRQANMDIFVPYLTRFLSDRCIDHKIFICNQSDTKIFNRGKTKNIAFDVARKEGFDYFAFHDIDILPEDDSCDYSYPSDYPIHLAAHQSKDNYNLLYPQYFGGCVMFTKEQFESVNGYYNDYWGWGWEDDDLFYRIIRKGFANVQHLPIRCNNKKVVYLNGKNSFIKSVNKLKFKNDKTNNFSIMLLVKPEILEESYLVGDKFGYFETPILSAGNNTILRYTKHSSYLAHFTENHYISDKGLDNEWALLFLTTDVKNKSVHFFINGTEIPLPELKTPVCFKKILHNFNGKKIVIGNKDPGFFDLLFKKNFIGRIAEVCIWNASFTKKQINQQVHDVSKKLQKDKLILWYDFEDINTLIYDKSGHNNHGRFVNCKIETANIDKIIKFRNPHRRNGKYKCLPHKKESFKQQFLTRWSKQSTIASKNEKIFKLKVKTGKIDTDEFGINNLTYRLIRKRKIFGNHVMIDAIC